MQIVSATIGLASAYRFDAVADTRETTVVRAEAGPGPDRFVREGLPDDQDVAKLIRLMNRYFESDVGSKRSEKLAEKIGRLVERMEAELEDQDVEHRLQLEVRRETQYLEREAVSYRAVGTITTSDGRQIDFQQALDLARVYARSESTVTRARFPVPSDDGGEQALGGWSGAGVAEPQARSVLTIGDGALGIDADGDGAIDPATELIGTSGDGFGELARFDDDNNGFIDEGDAVFDRLAVVSLGDQGLVAHSAGAAGLGAIYLGSVATPFVTRDPLGEIQSRVVRTGVYLTESGVSGVAQQIDLVI